MEWYSGGSHKLNIGQQFQERLRPLLLQRYGQQTLISCRSIKNQPSLQVQMQGNIGESLGRFTQRFTPRVHGLSLDPKRKFFITSSQPNPCQILLRVIEV